MVRSLNSLFAMTTSELPVQQMFLMQLLLIPLIFKFIRCVSIGASFCSSSPFASFKTARCLILSVKTFNASSFVFKSSMVYVAAFCSSVGFGSPLSLPASGGFCTSVLFGASQEKLGVRAILICVFIFMILAKHTLFLFV